MEPMTSPPLACTVDSCGQPLTRQPRAFACPAGHSYDIARSGYVNLLQPQDRRSLDAGDTREAVEARSRLFAAGVGDALGAALAQHAGALHLPSTAAIVDLGCGPGHGLAAIAAALAATAIGIDVSAIAIDQAARRYATHTWVVANADRRLPILDASVNLVLSVHARRNPAEAARILAPGGRVIIAVPAHDDLIELRTSVQGSGAERERADKVIAEHDALFSVVARSTVREQRLLTRDLLHDALRGTYRGARQRLAPQVDALDSMPVTLASDLLLFARRD
jgi:23S rRNA (guanine745-N1)-methyltransferase